MVKSTYSGDIQLDADCPWPGLAPFAEATQGFFHGRNEEIEQLFRLVRRANLAVLFGRSGLGKTSLIKAGLFPLLREGGFLPIYFRIDFQPSAQPPIDQFWKILAETLREYGVEGHPHKVHETMWEYFHGKDNDFWGPRNSLVMPVLVFDQFEEIFTLGRNVQASSQFLREVADLVENRTPQSLSDIIERDQSRIDDLDYSKDQVKVLIAFREDFLPEFEGCRSFMPSIMGERMRLTTMTGHQARDVILRSGGALIEEPVADRIIAFIAGPQSVTLTPDHVEIEPALISVICRELNERRRQAKREKITDDMLESAQGEIIAGFYDSSVSHVNEKTREFIQNELLTESGFRNSCAIDDAINTPGVTMEAIEHLIDCRLLRREIYLGTMRLELTHDLLAPVIKARRDQRRQAKIQHRHKRKIQAIVGAIALVLCGATIATTYYVHRQEAALERALREKDEKDKLYADKERLVAKLEILLKEKDDAQKGAVTNYNVSLGAAAKNADIIKQRVKEKRLSRGVAIDLLVNWNDMLEGLKVASPSQDSLIAEQQLTKSLHELYAELNDTSGMGRASAAGKSLAARISNEFPESAVGPQSHVQFLVAQSRAQLATGDFAGAEANARQSLAENTAIIASNPSTANSSRRLARDHFILGRVLARRHKLNEAEAEFRTALSLYEPDSTIKLIGREIAAVRRELARVLARQGRLDEGLLEAGSSVSTLTSMPDDKLTPNRAANIRGGIVLANLKYLYGDLPAAENIISDIEPRLDRWRGEDQDYGEWRDLYIWMQRSNGEIFLRNNKYDEAYAVLRKAIKDYRAPKLDGADYVISMSDYILSQAYMVKGQLANGAPVSGRKLLEESRLMLKEATNRQNSFSEGSALISLVDFALGDIAMARGNRKEALSRYATGIETMSLLVREYPDDIQWQWDLAMAQISESLIMAQTGMSVSSSRYEGARDTLKKILEAHPTVILWQQDFDRLPALPKIIARKTGGVRAPQVPPPWK